MKQGLVVFDLDGTLLRGLTVCEVLAESLGHLTRMRELESVILQEDIVSARLEIAGWYQNTPIERLLHFLARATLAPGTREGIARLQNCGVEIAIASLTWEFAVEWFAQQLNIKHYRGTRLQSTGEIEHIFPIDKARLLQQWTSELGISSQNVAAVGDSQGDIDLLMEATHSFFVGSTMPAGLNHVTHLPNVDIVSLTDRILYQFGIEYISSLQEQESHAIRSV